MFVLEIFDAYHFIVVITISYEKLSHSSPKDITIPGFTYTDAKNSQKNHTTKVWQQYWLKQSTKLNEIKMSILPLPPPSDFFRSQETIKL